ncbi:hypothetical protein [Kangiella sp.]|uniref:hypothetical protein n=1 Tax=Kangiella sp. TaxID=1920245 RepID=UPI0019B2F29B|nr:hypothetical protein [Kangiella sp.]MBD3653879.1 hypothetical protein [Kangiella sp.]
MNIDATLAVNVIFVWVLIATPLAYYLAKTRVKSVIPVTIVHFFLAFVPPLSLIALVILSFMKEKNAGSTPSEQS